MEAVLSPDFTDRVVDILSHHKERVSHLSEKTKRLIITSDERFVFPFEHTVIHSLYSGERKEGVLARQLKRASCYHSAYSCSYENSWLAKMPEIKLAVRDLFNVAYGLGTEFHDVENLRDETRRISCISSEQGAAFISIMAGGLKINLADRLELLHEEALNNYSRTIWNQYAFNKIPRLLSF
ncbi:MAG: hypothetical protein AABX73_01295 [Nanoarchaeota archaeon]